MLEKNKEHNTNWVGAANGKSWVLAMIATICFASLMIMIGYFLGRVLYINSKMLLELKLTPEQKSASRETLWSAFGALVALIPLLIAGQQAILRIYFKYRSENDKKEVLIKHEPIITSYAERTPKTPINTDYTEKTERNTDYTEKTETNTNYTPKTPKNN